jgi:hypothetical protein
LKGKYIHLEKELKENKYMRTATAKGRTERKTVGRRTEKEDCHGISFSCTSIAFKRVLRRLG